MCKLTFLTACTSPSLVWNVLDTCSNRIIFSILLFIKKAPSIRTKGFVLPPNIHETIACFTLSSTSLLCFNEHTRHSLPISYTTPRPSSTYIFDLFPPSTDSLFKFICLLFSSTSLFHYIENSSFVNIITIFIHD